MPQNPRRELHATRQIFLSFPIDARNLMKNTPKVIQVSQNHMATTFEFEVSVPDELVSLADRTLQEAHREVERIEAELTEFREESPVARLNQGRASRPISISLPSPLYELLDLCSPLVRHSDGFFDPTAKSKEGCEWSDIAWEKDNDGSFRLWKKREGAHLGFGAVGKGFALDRVRTLLERSGFRDYRLNAGGSSIVLSGFAGPGIPWPWGWSWSKNDRGTPLGIQFYHSTGAAVSIGVSGTQEKSRHLLIPHSRRDLGRNKTLLSSALVLSRSAAEADALSTALYVAGWRDGLRFVSAGLALGAAAVETEGGDLRWTREFQRLWGSPCP